MSPNITMTIKQLHSSHSSKQPFKISGEFEILRVVAIKKLDHHPQLKTHGIELAAKNLTSQRSNKTIHHHLISSGFPYRSRVSREMNSKTSYGV
jgi:hypothetical protein